MMSKIFQRAYQDLVVRSKQHISFWILSTFLPTFILSRLSVYFFPDFFINIRGTHIHHFAYGIFILAIAGYLGLTIEKLRFRPWIAGFFGIGLAAAFDEFGMWLRLEDDYWIRQSYDAILIITAFLINIVYFHKAWMRFLNYFMRKRNSKLTF